ncbi:MAG: hypothetical protein WEA82_05495 [Idiomarina sp.]
MINIKIKKLLLFFVVFLTIIAANLLYMKEFSDVVANALGDFFSVIIVPLLIGAFIGGTGYKISNDFHWRVSKIKTILLGSVIGLIIPTYYILMLSFVEGL